MAYLMRETFSVSKFVSGSCRFMVRRRVNTACERDDLDSGNASVRHIWDIDVILTSHSCWSRRPYAPCYPRPSMSSCLRNCPLQVWTDLPHTGPSYMAREVDRSVARVDWNDTTYLGCSRTLRLPLFLGLRRSLTFSL